MEYLTSLLDFVATYAEPVAYVVTACTAITAITPTTTDDAILNGILKVLNFAAGNFGKNRNMDDL